MSENTFAGPPVPSEWEPNELAQLLIDFVFDAVPDGSPARVTRTLLTTNFDTKTAARLLDQSEGYVRANFCRFLAQARQADLSFVRPLFEAHVARPLE